MAVNQGGTADCIRPWQFFCHGRYFFRSVLCLFYQNDGDDEYKALKQSSINKTNNK